MSTTTTHTIPITRVFTQILLPYDTIITRLHASLGKTSGWPPKDPSSLVKGKPGIESAVAASVGPHDFMLFQHYDWHPLLSAHGEGTGLKAKRVIFGNPLVARMMVKWDVKAGLFAPVSMLVMEDEGGKGTTCMYDLPSSLMVWEGSENREELEKAARALDEKVRVFVEFLGEEEEGARGGGGEVVIGWEGG